MLNTLELHRFLHHEPLIHSYSAPHFPKLIAARLTLVIFNEISFETTGILLSHCSRFEGLLLLPLNWRGMCSSVRHLYSRCRQRLVKGDLRVATELDEDPETDRSDLDIR